MSMPPDTAGLAETFAGNRARAGVRLSFAAAQPVSRLADLSEWGGYRVKFPATTSRAEAVLLNTGGGMAGGDRLEVTADLAPGAALTFTTQSAERVYRSTGPDTAVAVRLTVGAGADLAFIPQETILYSHSRLDRSVTADIAGNGRLLLAEAIVFGRAAHGERVAAGSLRDRWRIRRGGRLIFADDVLLEGAMSDHLRRPAAGAGADAAGCLLYVASDAADRLEEARGLLEGATCRAAASSWNGIICVRALGTPEAVRRVLGTVIGGMLRCTLPRVWLGS